MLIETEHRLRFQYDDFIRESQMEIRIEPQAGTHQRIHSFHLVVGPTATLDRYRDWNDNWVHHLAIRGYHDRIEILARSLIDAAADRPGLEALTEVPERQVSGELLDFTRFGGPVEHAPALESFTREVQASREAPLGEQVEGIAQVVSDRVAYQPGVTTWQSTVADVLDQRSGVCQDFAHLTLAMLRLRGIPCRYVSGYLHTGAEVAQSHAWIEVYGESAGWVGFDPTHMRVPDEDYVVVAVGRSYEDVSPNRGVYRGNAGETLEAVVATRRVESVDVSRVAFGVGPDSPDVPVYAQSPGREHSSKFGTEMHPNHPVRDQQQQQQQSRR
ncbi:transglutaminase family protein [Myxococcota bacterium]|nr:transglutaminase family protein [Myxococcota bacterium]